MWYNRFRLIHMMLLLFTYPALFLLSLSSVLDTRIQCIYPGFHELASLAPCRNFLDLTIESAKQSRFLPLFLGMRLGSWAKDWAKEDKRCLDTSRICITLVPSYGPRNRFIISKWSSWKTQGQIQLWSVAVSMCSISANYPTWYHSRLTYARSEWRGQVYWDPKGRVRFRSRFFMSPHPNLSSHREDRISS